MLMFVVVLLIKSKKMALKKTCEEKRKRGRSNSERLHVTGESRSGDTD